MDLAAGQNAVLASSTVEVTIAGAPQTTLHSRFGVAIAGVDAAGKAVDLDGQGRGLITVDTDGVILPDLLDVTGSGRFAFALERLPPAVARLQVVLFANHGGADSTLLALDHLECALSAGGQTMSFRPETRSRGQRAIVLVEFYKHKDALKVRANGQGYDFGLHAFARAISHPDPDQFLFDHDPAGGDTGASPDRRGGSKAYGSAFGVHAEGWILSNAHVVEGARSVEVASGEGARHSARIVLVDDRNDLALLKVDAPIPIIAFRETLGVNLGESVTVVGFPLAQILGSGPQVTTGSLSAVSGPADDCRLLQLSAPIQSGNSGGPILDSAGFVIGVVVATLARVGDGMPQNVNFGIKGGVARLVLDSQGLEPSLGAPAAPRSVQDIVRSVRGAVWRVEVQM